MVQGWCGEFPFGWETGTEGQGECRGHYCRGYANMDYRVKGAKHSYYPLHDNPYLLPSKKWKMFRRLDIFLMGVTYEE